jgi:hypothetical protein
MKGQKPVVYEIHNIDGNYSIFRDGLRIVDDHNPDKVIEWLCDKIDLQSALTSV